MSDGVQVIGICLVRNEDRFLSAALGNALALCDRLIVADHGSQDRTVAVAREWAARDPRIDVHRIAHPAESQDLIARYLDTPTWLFGVDGDEVYDPAGLGRLRAELLAGRYRAYRQVYGHVLHCSGLDAERGRARGFLAPPSRSMTKLYNFAALRAWPGPHPERLHGGTPVFNPGYAEESILRLHETTPWQESNLRCLHMVFQPRSSLDLANRRVRFNIAEQNNLGPIRRLHYRLRQALGLAPDSQYKLDKYRRGPEVEWALAPFFPEGRGWPADLHVETTS